MVMLLCIAVSVRPLAAGFVGRFYGAGFSAPGVLTSEAEICDLWTDLANLAAYVIVGSGVVLLTVGAVYAGLGLQVAKLIGLPIGVGRAVGNLITILVGLAVTLAAIGLSKALIGIIFRSTG